MAEHFRIVEWERYQHYKNRNPPWIKLHRDLLTSRTWVSLDDSSRVLAVACMLIAADTDNEIPADPAYIRRRAYLDADPDFGKLLQVGFLEYTNKDSDVASASASQADARQADASTPQANASPETETETEQSKEDSDPSGSVVGAEGPDPPDMPPIPACLDRANGAGRADPLPVKRAFDNYNIAAEDLGLPRAEKLTKDRQSKLRARLKEHGLEGWNRALVAIDNSPFLKGENDRGWRADLEFLLQPKSLNKVLEGGYSPKEDTWTDR